jgi:hypothetical protein
MVSFAGKGADCSVKAGNRRNEAARRFGTTIALVLPVKEAGQTGKES